MSARHISRAVVLQTLFGLDSASWDTSLRNDILSTSESELPGGDEIYTRKLLDATIAHRADVDNVIVQAAPDWPIDKISTIDRNILRIGLTELLFHEILSVPPKVAINEAIELAKEYGGNKSSKFINGVLGTVYKEMGQPRVSEGKEHKNLPVKHEDLAGAVVYAKDGNDIYLAMVHDIFGKWTLSKGHIEEGESAEECAKREIKEEMGIDITIEDKLGVNEYIANDPEEGRKVKKVQYFLAQSEFTDLKLGTSNGLDDVRWFNLRDVVNLNIYQDILSIITEGITKIANKTK